MSEESKETKRIENAAVGAVVGLAMLVMMFAALLFAYAFLRVSAGSVWQLSAEGQLPRLWPLLASVSAGLGSLALWRQPRFLRGVVAATCIALALCEGLTLVQAYRAGLLPSAGPVGSVLFGLTGLHALHVVAFSLLAAWHWRTSPRRHARAHPAWGWAMHVLGAVWLVIYASVYVF